MRSRPDDERREIARALVRLNARLLGAALAAIASVSLFAATIVLRMQGGPAMGQMLGQLGHLFPGYAVSLRGAFIGALWAAVAGYLVGWVLGRAYGPWILRAATSVLRGGEDAVGSRVVVELRPLPFAFVGASLLALALVLVTSWLWLVSGGHPSPHLALLSYYLPGYTTDPLGSLVGAAWLFAYAFVGAFAVAWLYGRVARARNAQAALRGPG